MKKSGQVMLLATLVLTSALVGVAGGWLSWLGGLNAANSVKEGASAFGVTLMIMIMVIQFLRDCEPWSTDATEQNAQFQAMVERVPREMRGPRPGAPRRSPTAPRQGP